MHVLTRAALLLGILVLPAMAGSQTITGTITGIVKDSSGGVLPWRHDHDDAGRNRPARDRRQRQRGPVYRPGRCPSGTYRVEASLSGFKGSAQGRNRADNRRNRARRFHARSGCARRGRRGRGAGVARGRADIVGWQTRGQPAHRGAAAQYAERVLADLPDARRRRNHRQRLRRSALHGQRRAAPQQRHAHRRSDRHVPDGERRRRAFRCSRRSTRSRNSR